MNKPVWVQQGGVYSRGHLWQVELPLPVPLHDFDYLAIQITQRLAEKFHKPFDHRNCIIIALK